MTYHRVLAALTVGLCVTYVGAGGGGGFEISRWTIDGGGAMRCTGGGFELSGTVGQLDAAVLTGAGFELSAGFWFGLAPGDHNEDGLVDLIDIGAFEQCMTGPAAGGPAEGCEAFDVDRSHAIDLADFAVVQGAFTGD